MCETSLVQVRLRRRVRSCESRVLRASPIFGARVSVLVLVACLSPCGVSLCRLGPTAGRYRLEAILYCSMLHASLWRGLIAISMVHLHGTYEITVPASSPGCWSLIHSSLKGRSVARRNTRRQRFAAPLA